MQEPKITMDEITKAIEELWYDRVPTPAEPSVDVWMGWMGKDEDRWWAESYQIKGALSFMTGRGGFVLFYKNVNTELPGYPIKYSIYGKPVSREEFIKTMRLEEEISVIDKELNLNWNELPDNNG